MKKRKTKNNVIKKNKNKIKPEYICRKNMMKRIKTPGNKEFTQSIFHNPGFQFFCVLPFHKRQKQIDSDKSYLL